MTRQEQLQSQVKDKRRKARKQKRGLPDTGFVRLPTILDHIPIGTSTWWAGVRDGRFPKPIKLSPQTTVWRAEDIHDLIQRIGQNADEVA